MQLQIENRSIPQEFFVFSGALKLVFLEVGNSCFWKEIAKGNACESNIRNDRISLLQQSTKKQKRTWWKAFKNGATDLKLRLFFKKYLFSRALWSRFFLRRGIVIFGSKLQRHGNRTFAMIEFRCLWAIHEKTKKARWKASKMEL